VYSEGGAFSDEQYKVNSQGQFIRDSRGKVVKKHPENYLTVSRAFGTTQVPSEGGPFSEEEYEMDS
jgi:hypothetical protein